MASFKSTTLRASAATSGASEQDSAVTLPKEIGDLFLHIEKTAEANADNLLTVRLQAQVGSDWVDVPYEYAQLTGALATAADTAADVTRAPNAVDASDDPPTYSVVAYYPKLPSNVVRIASVSSGTTPANTFSAIAYYQ